MFEQRYFFQLFRKLDSKGVSTTTNNEKLDKFMRDAIIVLRTHLSELQKVASLTEDFHTKYSQALRRRMSHDVLIGHSSESDDELADSSQVDQMLATRFDGKTTATLSTPEGTMTISFDPQAVFSERHGIPSFSEHRPRFDFTSIERNCSLREIRQSRLTPSPQTSNNYDSHESVSSRSRCRLLSNNSEGL
ncbi:hypothetical protein KIN20_007488 [Parelaphostrongylus tenuis]|uniref:MEIS N-terminal domain-containing protein n=1 Tax=Parelaphostrongylus tenuis TaxID=148309 RepID=A0AAD5QGY1_PARTN|nr:hypothetical protein KIN20_007488 [Parelaphostrongylus tenuis]